MTIFCLFYYDFFFLQFYMLAERVLESEPYEIVGIGINLISHFTLFIIVART